MLVPWSMDTTSPFNLADATVQHFVYDGTEAVLEFVDTDGAGAAASSLARRYLNGPAIDMVLAQEDVAVSICAAARVLWSVTNHQGSVTAVRNNTGALVNRIFYDSFGQVEDELNPSVGFITGYTGLQRDMVTGIDRSLTRWYDPIAQRWLQEDWLGLAPDGNPYRYVGNQPTILVDLSGLCPPGSNPGIPNLPSTSIAQLNADLMHPSNYAGPFSGVSTLDSRPQFSTNYTEFDGKRFYDPFDGVSQVTTEDGKIHVGTVSKGGALKYADDVGTLIPQESALALAIDGILSIPGVNIVGWGGKWAYRAASPLLKRAGAAVGHYADNILGSAKRFLPKASKECPSVVPPKIQVTSWAQAGIDADLKSGRWVMVGGPTVMNYLKTGLWGGKLTLTTVFPFVQWKAADAPFRNFITGFVDQTSLLFPAP